MPSHRDSGRQQGQSSRGEIGRPQDGADFSRSSGSSPQENILQRHQDFVVANRQEEMRRQQLTKKMQRQQRLYDGYKKMADHRIRQRYDAMRTQGIEHEDALKEIYQDIQQLAQRETTIRNGELADLQGEVWVAGARKRDVEKKIARLEKTSIRDRLPSHKESKAKKIAQLEKQLAEEQKNVENAKQNLEGPIDQWQRAHLEMQAYSDAYRDFRRSEKGND